jgi:hypothetical protein
MTHFDRFGQVQRGKLDPPAPGSIGVVVALGIEDSVSDGVVGDLFAMAIAKYKYRGS